MSVRRRILLSGPVMALRNELGLRPMPHVFPSDKNLNYSDLALWWEDEEISTRFVMPNVPAEFLNVHDAQFRLHINDADGAPIKTIDLCPDRFGRIESLSSEWGLDGNIKKGVFFIECRSQVLATSEKVLHLKHRWYSGYKKIKGPYSMVHGNTLVFWNSLDGERRGAGITQSTFWRRFSYHLQFNASNYDTVQLAFINPCKTKIRLEIDDSMHLIPPFGLKMIASKSDGRIRYRSNCCFLRPIVIASANDFLDVFHG